MKQVFIYFFIIVFAIFGTFFIYVQLVENQILPLKKEAETKNINSSCETFVLDDWKIVKTENKDWELYNLKTDPTEINNLATQNPEKLNELVTAYQFKQRELKEAAN